MNAVTTPVKMVSHPLDITGEGVDLEIRIPRNLTETRAALKNVRGEKDEAVRFVMLQRSAVTSNGFAKDVEVHGPKDGRPLIVEVNSGMVFLKVMSGRVLIWANSSAGNSVDVLNDAQVDVVVAPEHKATVTAHHQSRVTIHKGEGSWGLQRANDKAELTYAV